MKTLDELHVKMDLLAKNQMALCSAMDLFWQAQNATVIELKAGLAGTAEGVSLAIADLRKELGEVDLWKRRLATSEQCRNNLAMLINRMKAAPKRKKRRRKGR